jgi:hypothetical protein
VVVNEFEGNLPDVLGQWLINTKDDSHNPEFFVMDKKYIALIQLSVLQGVKHEC